MELPLFISSRRIEISLAVLSGFVPFQQHIEEFGVVLAGTIQAEAEFAINLVHMGFSAVAIADRVGHESIDITYRYYGKQVFMVRKVSMYAQLLIFL